MHSAARIPAEGIDQTSSTLEVRDLGRMAYAPALELQRDALERVAAARTQPGDGGRMTLLLVEHDPPVITVSRRPGAQQHLLAGPAQLLSAGVEVAQTDRGGDITYHGPGQLVAYPILDLNRLGLRLHGYMRLLEQIVIDVLAEFGIAGTRDACATGVWVEGEGAGSAVRGQQPDVASRESSMAQCNAGGSHAKICAMGVRVSRWVSMHGLALNVTTNLSHFDLIVPCGLAGRSVTSMQRELGEQCPSMPAVKHALAARFQRAVAELLAQRDHAE